MRRGFRLRSLAERLSLRTATRFAVNALTTKTNKDVKGAVDVLKPETTPVFDFSKMEEVGELFMQQDGLREIFDELVRTRTPAECGDIAKWVRVILGFSLKNPSLLVGLEREARSDDELVEETGDAVRSLDLISKTKRQEIAIAKAIAFLELIINPESKYDAAEVTGCNLRGVFMVLLCEELIRGEYLQKPLAEEVREDDGAGETADAPARTTHTSDPFFL